MKDLTRMNSSEIIEFLNGLTEVIDEQRAQIIEIARIENLDDDVIVELSKFESSDIAIAVIQTQNINEQLQQQIVSSSETGYFFRKLL